MADNVTVPLPEGAVVNEAVESATQAIDGASATVEGTAEDIQSSMDAASDGAEHTFNALATDGAGNTAEVSSGYVADPSLLADLTTNTIYLMGMSFILGVLFTVFILLVLDFMRRNAGEEEKK